MKVINTCRLLFVLSLCFIPLWSNGQGQEKAIGGMITIFLSILFALTALSAYFLVKFYNERLRSSRSKALVISTALLFVSAFMLVTAEPLPYYAQDELAQRDAMHQRNIAYLILIPNLFIITAALIMKPYISYEALLGRLDEDRRVITWVGLKQLRTNEVELAYHKVVDKWQGRFDDLYNFSPYMDGRMNTVLLFDSFESAADYVRSTHGLEKPRFVNKSKLKAEYRRLLSSEKSKGKDKNQNT